MLAKVFGSFAKNQLSVDVLASSEVSVSLTLDMNQEDESCIGCWLSEFYNTKSYDVMNILCING